MTATATATAIKAPYPAKKHSNSAAPAPSSANIKDVSAPESALLPLHRLAFAEAVKPAADLGVKGEMLWLPLSKLRVDPRYQRPILANGRKTIRRIIERFEWSRFSPLVVGTRPGGLFAIIDGQHRATAALTHGGIVNVPCLVIRGGPEAEAAAFAIINGEVTAITGTQIHRARVVAGDKDAVRLDKVCERGGARVLRFPPGPGYWKPGDTLAIGTLRTCMARYGEDALITALQCVTETDDGNPGLLGAALIQGLCDALAGNERWLDSGEALFKAIETVGVRGILRTANRLRETKRASGWVLISETVRGLLGRTLDKSLPAPKGRKAA